MFIPYQGTKGSTYNLRFLFSSTVDKTFSVIQSQSPILFHTTYNNEAMPKWQCAASRGDGGSIRRPAIAKEKFFYMCLHKPPSARDLFQLYGWHASKERKGAGWVQKEGIESWCRLLLQSLLYPLNCPMLSTYTAHICHLLTRNGGAFGSYYCWSGTTTVNICNSSPEDHQSESASDHLVV